MSIQRPDSFHGNPDGMKTKAIGADNGSRAEKDINFKAGKQYRDTTINASWREWEQLVKGPGGRTKADFMTYRGN